MNVHHKFDIAVIGGGPAGMTAAGQAALLGANVILLERNAHPGKKLLITGKGRCNITNTVPFDRFIPDFGHGGKFLYSSLSKFSNEDIVVFFNSLGLPTKIERGGRIFPQSDDARSVLFTLEKFLKESGVVLRCGWKVERIKTSEGGFIIESKDRPEIHARCIILAAGGASYPSTGSDGSGAQLAKMAGHEIVPLYPALVPFESGDKTITTLSGVSLRNIGLTLFSRRNDEDWRKEYSETGEMLFTHFGLSGPLVIDASRGAAKLIGEGRELAVSINFKPALDAEKLEERVRREAAHSPVKNMINLAATLLPRRLVPVVLERAGISPELKAGQLTAKQRKALVQILRDFRIAVSGLRPMSEAIVTGGGVSLDEVTPGTLESKLVPGLYFCGEVLDLDGPTGGYNLTAAFSTGHLAGLSAAGKALEPL
ncbi:MAG: NAD(P)/FAD-dependent oxidoreductase [Chloroflexi bacterium]|nr:NAD(P)/FAD-dependent oxidoreductase [Chloroflexota bacterium]